MNSDENNETTTGKKRKAKDLPPELASLRENDRPKFRMTTAVDNDPKSDKYHEEVEVAKYVIVHTDEVGVEKSYDLETLTIDQIRKLAFNINVSNPGNLTKFQCRRAIATSIKNNLTGKNRIKRDSLPYRHERIHPRRGQIRYHIIAAEAMTFMAKRLVVMYPERFIFHETAWNKFPDGTDCIEVGGFHPHNRLAREHVLFLASFHNNDVTLSQFSVMIMLLQSFIETLTVVLPYSPVGTMERVVREGQVATAATYAHIFSSLPSCGKPTRLMVYDLHTLQNRFYLHGNAVANLQTTIPILKEIISGGSSNIGNGGDKDGDDDNTRGSHDRYYCIAFPDDGAAKRFGPYFKGEYDIIVCGKTRTKRIESECSTDNQQLLPDRVVTIHDGSPSGRHVVIVDDIVQTGGTLYEAGCVLKRSGAITVSAFVTHAVFPNDSWKRFSKEGDFGQCFHKFWVTNSIPTVTSKLPTSEGMFEVLDITSRIAKDLERL